jgi:hypothetical protein
MGELHHTERGVANGSRDRGPLRGQIGHTTVPRAPIGIIGRARRFPKGAAGRCASRPESALPEGGWGASVRGMVRVAFRTRGTVITQSQTIGDHPMNRLSTIGSNGWNRGSRSPEPLRGLLRLRRENMPRSGETKCDPQTPEQEKSPVNGTSWEGSGRYSSSRGADRWNGAEERSVPGAGLTGRTMNRARKWCSGWNPTPCQFPA